MRKLLIVSDSLRTGGIQKSLENFLNIIDYNCYDVTLFLFNHNESFKYKINKNVKIQGGKFLLKLANTPGVKKQFNNNFNFILRKTIALMCLILGANFVYKILFSFEKKLGDFDAAISFSNNINNKTVYFGSNKFVLEKTIAKKKIAWLHVDYDEMNMHNNINTREYEKFDSIVAVSHAVKNTFLKSHPYFENKVKVIYNSVAEEDVKKKANEYDVEKHKMFTMVSVGRLDENKSPLSYIKVAAELKRNNVKFHWWIIGDGPLKNDLIKQIHYYELSEELLILGELSNPYPYIKNADLFISASKSESFGLAIAEALCLNTPVVARNYPALKEIIDNSKNGIIFNGSDQELGKLICNLIQNGNFYLRLKEKTQLNIDSRRVIEQFTEVMKEEMIGD